MGCGHDGTRFQMATPLCAPRALTKTTSQPDCGAEMVKPHVPFVRVKTTLCHVFLELVTTTTTRSLTRQLVPTTQYRPVPEIRTVAFCCAAAADPMVAARSATAATSTSAIRAHTLSMRSVGPRRTFSAEVLTGSVRDRATAGLSRVALFVRAVGRPDERA